MSSAIGVDCYLASFSFLIIVLPLFFLDLMASAVTSFLPRHPWQTCQVPLRLCVGVALSSKYFCFCMYPHQSSYLIVHRKQRTELRSESTKELIRCFHCILSFDSRPQAIPQDKQETKHVYECPVYKTRQRGPTFGRSTSRPRRGRTSGSSPEWHSCFKSELNPRRVSAV